MRDYTQFKLDIHVHTTNSSDSCINLETIPEILDKKGLDGLAITDHDKITKYDIKEKIVLQGAEISTINGHLIALNIKKNINSGMSMGRTINEVHSQGGIAIIAHPYNFPQNCNLKKLDIRPDGIEVLNARVMFCNISTSLSKRMAVKLSIPMTGGSDSHIPDTVGDSYTIVEAESDSIDDIIDAFRMGRITFSGNCSSLRKRIKSRIYSITKKL
ncbi:MAG: PHP domain-containing protein [Candidatus Bathyarchaeota archaeon]|nr:PHP domain-containing protein [Candidatus Bathyarchaeota archaeon]